MSEAESRDLSSPRLAPPQTTTPGGPGSAPHAGSRPCRSKAVIPTREDLDAPEIAGALPSELFTTDAFRGTTGVHLLSLFCEDNRTLVLPALRDECLNEHLFHGLAHARRLIEAWRIDYNTERPHTSLDGLTPLEFARQRARASERSGGSTLRPVANRLEQGQNRNGLYL